jgi:hypothetical protein
VVVVGLGHEPVAPPAAEGVPSRGDRATVAPDPTRLSRLAPPDDGQPCATFAAMSHRSAAAALAALSLLVAACGGATVTPSGPTLPPVPAVASAAAQKPASSSPAGASSSSAAVAIDPALVDLLPSTVAGLAVVRATATEEAAQASPRFADAADGFAAVEAIATNGSDLAIASIIRLRPEASPATFYADWRPGYDDAACAPAGGVSTRETQTIGGRSVDVTHCVEGATVYHVWLQGDRVLVSVLDVGRTGLGRSLIEGAKDRAP